MEISRVETVQNATLDRRIILVLLICTFDHARIQGGDHVYATSAYSLNQVSIHSIFLNVETYPHDPFRERKCSRSRRSSSISSAAMSASTSS